MSEETISSFEEFYPYYLGEHLNPTCRAMHYMGSTLSLVFLMVAILTLNPLWLLAALSSGYSMAWIGHFFIEQNKPASFQYPWFSFMADWVMYKDFLTGKLSVKLSNLKS